MQSKSQSAGSSYEYTNEVFKIPATVLLQSRIVVEKTDFVSTGMLSYAEGDIVEIEISEYKIFELGESVKLTVYTAGGIITFHSTVVAKDEGSLIVINPPQNRRRFVDKRNEPRIEVKEKGKILGLTCLNTKEKQLFNEALELTVHNVSMNGLGFTLQEKLKLTSDMIVEAELDLGFQMPCAVKVIRCEQVEDRYYYGGTYVELVADKENSLRAFVLKKQVELYFIKKNFELMQRLVEE